MSAIGRGVPAPPPPTTAVNALEGLFATHEVRVLGAVGLLTGSISIFFVKILGLLSPFVGISGIALVTVIMLLLDPRINPRSIIWWIRMFCVVLIAIIITSPQLYDAWTTAVTESQNNGYAKLGRSIEAAQRSQQSILQQ